MLLKTRQARASHSNNEEVYEKTIADLSDNSSGEDDNIAPGFGKDDGRKVLPANDESMEFRLHVESSDDQDMTSSRERPMLRNKDGMEDVEITQDKQDDGQQTSIVNEDLETDKSDITGKNPDLYRKGTEGEFGGMEEWF
jgi:hypothetical protein